MDGLAVKMKDKPIYGSISADGALFTVHYAAEGTSQSIHKEGTSLEVFDDCPEDMPVIRYDKAGYEKSVLWLRQHYFCEEYCPVSSKYLWQMLPLYDYLGTFAQYGIPVEELRVILAG
jgi:hypothetical protein